MSHFQRTIFIFMQAVLQTIFWYFVELIIRDYIRQNYKQCKWFQQWVSSKRCKNGNNGLREETIIHQMGMFAQHIFGGIFVSLGWYFSSSQLFIIGALSEFSNEFYGVIECAWQRFIVQRGYYYDDPFIYKLLFIHHNGAFTIILPACIWYSNNQYLQLGFVALQVFGALMMPLMVLKNSRNVYDLMERGQFMVYMTMSWLNVICMHWIIYPYAVMMFMWTEWSTMPHIVRITLMVHFILMKSLHIMKIGKIKTYYNYMWGGKARYPDLSIKQKII